VHWQYTEGDPSVVLWTSAIDRFELAWPNPAPRILELGCCETDWIERLLAQNPDAQITGVDARATRAPHGWRFVQGDATQSDLFAPASFDVVVLLGALEHFGLGFYGDPVVEDGDIRTMENIVRWLRPGGWVYFDVPTNPTSYVTANRHFRVYAPATLTERLLVPGLVERGRAYSLSEPRAGVWCDPPTVHREPYYYAMVAADRI
jgi:SAM-dependent methyltransferase